MYLNTPTNYTSNVLNRHAGRYFFTYSLSHPLNEFRHLFIGNDRVVREYL